MPITPPNPSAPYDTANTVLNFARVFANDAGETLLGELLANDQPYTFVLLNSAWRDLQDELGNNGFEGLYAETDILGIPPTTATDPSTQAWIGFGSYWDGVNTFTTPILPADMIMPLRLWERRSGNKGVFHPMVQSQDGLQSRPKVGVLGEWEWRDDRIYLVGANQPVDLRLRYNRYLADIPNDPNAPIPILRAAKALAYYVVSEWANSRGSLQAAGLRAQGDKAVEQIIARTARREQRANHRRRPYSTGHRGWGF